MAGRRCPAPRLSPSCWSWAWSANLYGGHLANEIGRLSVLVASALASAALVIPIIYYHLPARRLDMGHGLPARNDPVPQHLHRHPHGPGHLPREPVHGVGHRLGADQRDRSPSGLIGQTVSNGDLSTALWVIVGLTAVSAPLSFAFPALSAKWRHRRPSGPTPEAEGAAVGGEARTGPISVVRDVRRLEWEEGQPARRGAHPARRAAWPPGQDPARRGAGALPFPFLGLAGGVEPDPGRTVGRRHVGHEYTNAADSGIRQVVGAAA